MTMDDVVVEQGSRQAKIFDSFDALDACLPQRRIGKKVVHCHGVFDLLHIGHMTHFNCAR